jgi:hypothetical protein
MHGAEPLRHSAGSMNNVCEFCGARSWSDENINCCAAGEIQLQTFPDIPEELSAVILLPHVLQNIRAYNSAFCMASVGHKSKGLPDGMFMLGGRPCHRIGSLLPDAGCQPSFAQIYHLDVDEATSRRLQIFGGERSSLRAHSLGALHNLMTQHNPWVRQYVAAARDNAPHLVWRCTDDISSMQIGALVADGGSRRDVIVQRRSGQLLSLHDGHCLYHPLAYPLLFPIGTPGWSEDSVVVSSDWARARKVSLLEWGRFHLMHRERPTHVQKCQKLSMEFYCDLFAQIESRQAEFHRLPQQQNKYRTARVAALEDQLRSGVDASEIGQPVIRLPAGFVGSAKWYQQLYFDAIALPMRFGKPDLFITFTCNPRWTEIQEALPPGADYKHHADIVERVFMIKLKQLIADIVDEEIFGSVLAYVCRVEWQARGLPHAHMLYILKDKILSARHIDSVVSAEIPDPAADPELHQLVATHQLHARCDIDESHSCRQDVNGKLCDCRRHFPKQMSPSTVIVADGYPMYKRRGNFTITTRNATIISDNWVVPYNRYLLKRYQAHCNIEVCAHFRCFKYVYKYTFKKPDETHIAVDEIQAHWAGRLISVTEAVHRLLGLSLHKEFPPVTRLDVHLPRQHAVVFDPTADEQSLLEHVFSLESTLTGWFQLNAQDQNARSLLYHEVPEHYTWGDRRWQPRVRDRMCVGRMYNVSHHNTELWALRRLLRVVRGATSFEDLATFNGRQHATFHSACMARGLFNDDSDLIASFMEIVQVEVSVDNIRRHFATMLVHCAPSDPVALFNTFVDDLCDETASVPAALIGVEMHMAEMGRSLRDLGFELPEQDPAAQQPRTRRRLEERPATAIAAAASERDQLLPLFTTEQHDGLNQVLASLGSNERSNVFAVLSSAGCGKTVFANGLSALLRSRGCIVVAVASSALAAMLLTNGTTAHSRFRIPIPANEYTVCNLSREERIDFRRASVILWDECSMIHRHVADTVDRTLQDIMRDPRPFGGKTVIFTGDFKQLLPVVRHGKGHDHTIQRCAWWRDVKVLRFTVNWRALQSPAFSAFLEEVGNGRVDVVEVPSEHIVDDYDAMIDAVYGTTFDCCNQILALTLETCAEVNRLCIDRLPGPLHERPAADSYVDCTDPDSFPPDYVESVHMNGAPPFMLRMKLGAKFMCIRNISQHRGLVNGTMLQVVAIGSRFIQVRVLSGKSAGSVELLMPHVFSISPDQSGLPFTITRRQYPMIPAYCLSVHKAQGQTIKVCGLIFESDPFTHGQLYAALSRVAAWSCLYVKLHHQENQVHNVVLKHLLGEF